MVNKNNQISKLNSELSKEFTSQLLLQSVTETKFSKKETSSFFGGKKTIETSNLPFYEAFKTSKTKLLSELHKPNGSLINSIEVDNKKLKLLLSSFEKEVKNQAVLTFNEQISSLQNGYLAIIESQSDQKVAAEEFYLTEINKREFELSLTKRQLEKEIESNISFNSVNIGLRDKIKDLESRYLNYPQSPEKNKKMLKSKESSSLDKAREDLLELKFRNIDLENDFKISQGEIRALNLQKKKALETYNKHIASLEKIQERSKERTENFNNLMFEKLVIETELTKLKKEKEKLEKENQKMKDKILKLNSNEPSFIAQVTFPVISKMFFILIISSYSFSLFVKIFISTQKKILQLKELREQRFSSKSKGN